MIEIEIKNHGVVVGIINIGPELSNYLIPQPDNDNLYAEFKSPAYASYAMGKDRREDIEYLVEDCVHIAMTRKMKKISELKRDGVQPSDTSCFAPSREPNKPEDSVIALLNHDMEDDLA